MYDKLSLYARTFSKVHKDFSYEKVLDTVLPFFESVDSPTSLGLWLCLKYDPMSYLEYELDPGRYVEPYLFKRDYACAELLRKADFLPVEIDRERAAMSSFLEAEVKCIETNQRVFDVETTLERGSVAWAIRWRAQRKISQLLGRVVSLDELDPRFGPGNNVGVSKETSSIDKINIVPTVTGELKAQLPLFRESFPSWNAYLSGSEELPTNPCQVIGWKVVAGSKLGFVPKSAKTDRPICTEPLINSMYQNAIGDILVRKLKKAGCDLSTQARNQQLCKLGSTNDSLATIDLKAASDTISMATVFDLLPFGWFSLLDSVRSKAYTYDERTYKFYKFSSMGNGYTFPLESLLFLALARSACDVKGISSQDVSVFGDDIVCPKEIVPLLKEVFDYYGFTINKDKSFAEGPFRESCGHDYFKGYFVRPIYLKRGFSPEYLISRANILHLDDHANDYPFKVLRAQLLKWIPNYVRKSLVGPCERGDGHIHVPYSSRYFKKKLKYSKRKRGWEGHPYYTVKSIPVTRTHDSYSAYTAALYEIYQNQGGETPSSRRGRYVASIRDRRVTKLTVAYHPWYL